MVAGLETRIEGGVKFATFASFIKPGWHALGTVFDEPKTSEEILEIAHMDNWNLHCKTVQLYLGSEEDKENGVVNTLELPNDFAIFRNNPFDGKLEPLGMVKSRYTPVQNEQLFELGDAIIGGEEGAYWETAGSIKGGTVVFGVIKFENPIVIGQEDTIDKYLMVTAGHIGNLPVIAQVTPVRVVCANTWNMAMGNYSSRVSFRHTASVNANLENAKDSLGRAHRFYKVLGHIGNALIEVPVGNNDYLKMIDELYPKPEEDIAIVVRGDGEPEEKVLNQRSITLWNNKRDTLVDVWNEKTDRGNTLGEAKGTAWGAVNAITETIDWHGRETGGFLRTAGFNDPKNLEKTQALNLVTEKAGIKLEEFVLA
jgi:phage/plasmid-like protein (TIGR03299 family)